MSENKSPSLIARIMENPIGQLVIGFLLTGVLGQSLSWAYSERQADTNLRRAALESIRDFTSLEDSLLQRADRLRDSIMRGAPPAQVAERATTYYKASVEWGAALDANHLRFREYFGFTDTNFLEFASNHGLSPTLKAMDECLSNAEIAVASGDADDAIEMLEGCEEIGGIDSLIKSAQACSHSLAATMTEFVMLGLECSDAQWRENGRKVYDRVMKDCGKPSDAKPGSIWPYADAVDSKYDSACIRDDSWFDRLSP